MKLINLKRGDKDDLGDVINKIFYRKANNEEVEYLIYEISNGEIRFDAGNSFAGKLVNYSSSVVAVKSALDINPELKKKYNPLLANLIRSVFESDVNADLNPLFVNLQEKIVGNILSIARLKYLKQCVYYLLAIIAFILLLWLYNSTISGKYFFKEFSNYFLNMVYLATAGAVGGFISVALKIDKIYVDPFIPFRRTKLDADVRIILAMISGILIFWFLKSGFIGFIDTSKLNLSTSTGILFSLSLAVVCGFSERLIPSILSEKENKYIGKISTVNKNNQTLNKNESKKRPSKNKNGIK